MTSSTNRRIAGEAQAHSQHHHFMSAPFRRKSLMIQAASVGVELANPYTKQPPLLA
jgi:hypothetical protein